MSQTFKHIQSQKKKHIKMLQPSKQQKKKLNYNKMGSILILGRDFIAAIPAQYIKIIFQCWRGILYRKKRPLIIFSAGHLVLNFFFWEKERKSQIIGLMV